MDMEKNLQEQGENREKDYEKEGKNYEERHHSVDFWNSYAPNFRKDRSKHGYESKFLELADIRPGETVFDMGCGSGTLALPLAEAGHEVYAGDFSEKMLEMLEAESEKRGLTDKIHTFKIDWEEDWSGFDIPVCDVAVSSRSMIVSDYAQGIKKLLSKAGRRVCISTSTTQTPKFNARVGEYVGFPYADVPQHAMVMDALFKMGYFPELRYIDSNRIERFDDREDCIARMEKKFFGGKLNDEQKAKLETYVSEHLKESEKDGKKCFVFDEEWPVKWAFVSWDLK